MCWIDCSGIEAANYFKIIKIGNRPFAWWRHFTTMTRILQGFAFFCKLGLLLFKPHWGYKI